MHTQTCRGVARLVFPITLFVSGGAFVVQAAPIGYAVRSDGDDQLYRIDLATGAATAIGPVGFPSVEGLSFQPSTGVLFGVDDETLQLLTIDVTTGAGSLVGDLGTTDVDLGLTFDSSTPRAAVQGLRPPVEDHTIRRRIRSVPGFSFGNGLLECVPV